ncbi:phosphatase PAP2 family protein [Sphingobacterium thalpophilum]|uniref:phosphatase PAP2 family protein n=1 Tax=Sphingobacterium thalpophilum TaxID=259 RepID=UPI0024A7971C|nr:phosphatase PAP2 family protein [Sphingobacterium thalpophilum]
MAKTNNYLILAILILLFRIPLHANPQDSTSTCNNRQKPLAAIVSTGMLGYGLSALVIHPLRQIDITTKEIANRFSPRRTYMDDLIQYTPALAVFALDLTGLKAKHTIPHRLTVLFTAAALTASTTHILKNSTAIWRPDRSNRKSFPSGHTATAFMGAHILFKEYRHQNIWIASSGYVVAGTTGLLRILNNKHWLSDVLAGAGIGILSTELAYVMTPKIKKIIKPDLSGDHPMLKATFSF